MPRFNCINFYQNIPKIKLSFPKNKKIQNFQARGALLPSPHNTPPPIIDFWISAWWPTKKTVTL